MKTETLSIDLLRLDGGSQARIKTSEETVEDYAELITTGNGEWPFEALDVFHDGTDYFLADGFHRTLAALRVNRASVPCRVHSGTAKDARIFGMTANDQHGLRMSRKDRRKNVVWLLATYPTLTQAEVSAKSGVCLRTVKIIVGEQKKPKVHNAPQVPKTKGKSSGTGSKEAKAAEKAKAKAADKAAKDKDKADAAAEKEKAKEAAAAEKKKAKEAAAAEKAKAKEDAKAAKAAAKAKAKADAQAALPKDEQARLNRKLAQTHIDAAVRAVDDLHRVKANQTKRMAAIRALQGVELW